ncbi:MAG: potassium/proton antiporter, partial [Muribaculaceae bacterium]|nr:potassium/proton antiporter [Muribaculaceae bacterium]
LVVQLLLQFGIGGAAGVVMGRVTLRLVRLYRRIGSDGAKREDSDQAASMISILILASVFLTFTATSALQGNGYLAVYILGIYLGNAALPAKRGISKFMSSLTWLAQIVVFLMLGLLVNPHEMLSVAPVSILIGAFMILFGRPLSVLLSLAPMRNITMRSKLFVSWVGLRGAVPIIFATYPVVAGIEGASQIFNIVFFVTLLSLLVQGTTVIGCARRLKLTDPSASNEDEFGVEIDEQLPTSLETLRLTDRHLASGDTLRHLSLPPGSLVMMVKRGGKYMVPNGSLPLRRNDVLLIIKEDSEGE